jgi:hypothetical protein
MIELYFLIRLSKHIASLASLKGRNGLAYFVFTIVFWVSAETVGAFIGMSAFYDDTAMTYCVALAFALVSGLISFIIVKIVSPKEFKVSRPTPLKGASALNTPGQLNIRMSKSTGGEKLYGVYLNGQHLGFLKNGENIQALTQLAENVI